MLLSAKEAVWTPILAKQEIGVYLSADFSALCRSCVLTEKAHFLKVVWQKSGESGEPLSGFLTFDNDTIMIRGIYSYREGLWLTHDSHSLTPKGLVRFTSHNADKAWEQIWLLRTFQEWVNTAIIYLQEKNLFVT